MTPVVVINDLRAGLNDPESVIWAKMAARLERYIETGERPLPTAPRMCVTCPFRGASADYKREGAMIPAQDWLCHTDETERCAGHHAAQAKFGCPTVATLKARSRQCERTGA